MNDLAWHEFVELFGPAIVAALVAGAVAPLVGNFLFLRRTGFYGVALPQFAAAGVAFGFAVLPLWSAYVGLGHLDEAEISSGSHAALNYHLLWASLFTFGGLAALALLGRKGRGSEAARVAAAFSIASAVTILAAHESPAGEVFVHSLLRGEILLVGVHELEILAGVYGLVLLALVVFQRELVLVAFDREAALVTRRPVLLLEALLLNLVGATVSTGVMIVGPVVLFGLLVVPPLAARGLARSMKGYFWWSATVGLAAAVAGVALSYRLDWPLGPAVVVAAAAWLPPSWLVDRWRG
ncbi:MAG: metal ABC transporter permease [Planctomycetes bacterium]|nr:metal ABC transporter permease [Planctomycetota bacterium]